jgi:hypothetical protein
MIRFVFGLTTALCAAAVSAAFAQPAEIIIIRHAEKPPEGSHLSLAGRERAAALVPYFLETPELLEFKTPVAIYAQAPKNGTSSVRAIETIKPLADTLKLPINEPYVRDDYRKLVAEIMARKDYEGHTVLICWEHKMILDIAKELGVENVPSNWPAGTYDRTWVVRFAPGQKPQLRDLPQHLMFGDSEK